MSANKNIKVVELFAGVGGFRVGLERASNLYQTIWANQWEPSRKSQDAFNCYAAHFSDNTICSNIDIAIAKKEVPSHDLLVGGFPCQDYSVARTGAQGLEGKKGVLWWEINDIVNKCKPSYILLENVDRLIKSPAKQRGRDFGVILRCLYDAGYAVEWRVINAADYGFAQRRRRTFIFAFKNTTKLFKQLSEEIIDVKRTWKNWLLKDGFFAPAFPIECAASASKEIETGINQITYNDLSDVSDNFQAILFNSGVMINGDIYSLEIIPKMVEPITLRKIRETNQVDEKFFLNGSLEKWIYLKGSKKINRIKPNGEPYVFSEGSLSFPDSIDLPARTMLTSEATVNRSSHVIEDAVTGRLRLLTPIECERINGFPDNWTNTGMPEKFRYFVMGNALVVPVITQIGKRILEIY